MLSDRILNRDRRALARGLSLIESNSSEAQRLLAFLPYRLPGAHIVGVTGSAGTGKSTFINTLTTSLRSRSQTVAVLAIDPSSPISSGALLADRIRMERHSGDAGVFVRSMASRGQPGGLAPATVKSLWLLNAAGFDFILLETVGIGQGEVDVSKLADVTLLLVSPLTGDDIQANKAGVMEVASIYVVNKSDLPGARELLSQLRSSVGHGAPVISVNSHTGDGLQAVLQHLDSLLGTASAEQRSRRLCAAALEATLRERIDRALRTLPRDTPSSSLAEVEGVANNLLDALGRSLIEKTRRP